MASAIKLPVVVSLHLEIEHLALGVAGLGDQVFIQELKHVAADVTELLLDLLTVLLGHLDKRGKGMRKLEKSGSY